MTKNQERVYVIYKHDSGWGYHTLKHVSPETWFSDIQLELVEEEHDFSTLEKIVSRLKEKMSKDGDSLGFLTIVTNHARQVTRNPHRVAPYEIGRLIELLDA